MPRLYHVSDRDDIDMFHPRPRTSPPDAADPVVWAVTVEQLPNLVLPRDCPRVCVRAGAETTATDIDRFLEGDPAAHLITIETGWMERITTESLWLYEMPTAPFVLDDAEAGYLVARQPVAPVGRSVVRDIPGWQATSGVRLRVADELWPLRDAVAASSLRFSIMRMRNAQPRPVTP